MRKKITKISILLILVLSAVFFFESKPVVEPVNESDLYEITFYSTWTSETHPNDYPSNPHFSPMVIVSHNSSLFKPGEKASLGIKDMAETGSTKALLDEIQNHIDLKNIFDVKTGNVIFLSSKTETNPVKIRIPKEYPKLTAVSMIAPSPDWFIAIEDIDVIKDGSEVLEMKIFPKVYDAGTDSGETFESDNKETTPRENIHLFREYPLAVNGNVESLGYFIIKKIE